MQKLSRIDFIILHHSLTPNGRHDTISDVRRWHVNERGWDHIGYHFVIELDGTIQQGVSTGLQGYHCKGYNHKSLGICLIGTDEFSIEQWRALKRLLESLLEIDEVTGAAVVAHVDLIDPDPKRTCPGFDVTQYIADGCRPVIKNVLDGAPPQGKAYAPPILEPSQEELAELGRSVWAIARLIEKFINTYKEP